MLAKLGMITELVRWRCGSFGGHGKALTTSWVSPQVAGETQQGTEMQRSWSFWLCWYQELIKDVERL